jgi:hypothetical protein
MQFKLLMTTLFIYVVCKDAWFVNSEATQHLAFQKKKNSTYEEFPLNHKYILETIVCLMYMRRHYHVHLVKWDYYIYWRCVVCPEIGKESIIN